MRLVENWKNAWKWFSMWAMAVLAAAPVAWMSLPPEIQESVPAKYRIVVLVMLLIGGIAGRLVSQTKE